jgi:hypothetical protein
VSASKAVPEGASVSRVSVRNRTDKLRPSSDNFVQFRRPILYISIRWCSRLPDSKVLSGRCRLFSLLGTDRRLRNAN